LGEEGNAMAPQVIDVTGLPQPVVDGLQELVNGLRTTYPAGAGVPDSPLTLEEKIAALRAFAGKYKGAPLPRDDREALYEDDRTGGDTAPPAQESARPAELSKEEWLKRFREWAGSWNPGVAVSVDREEMYGELR
jgi:hypothetical protein